MKSDKALLLNEVTQPKNKNDMSRKEADTILFEKAPEINSRNTMFKLLSKRNNNIKFGNGNYSTASTAMTTSTALPIPSPSPDPDDSEQEFDSLSFLGGLLCGGLFLVICAYGRSFYKQRQNQPSFNYNIITHAI